jgi:regulatory protein
LSTRAATSQPSPPSEVALREAALRHLARYAATRARLLRVLERRIDRWLRATRAASPEDDALGDAAVAAKGAARRVVADLAATGVIDDEVYAARRAKALLRAGRSRARAAQHLAVRGIDAEIIRAAVPVNEQRELAAALLVTRKRRLGAFAAADTADDPKARRRAMGVLQRAGFGLGVARDALAATVEEAEAAIEALRRTS